MKKSILFLFAVMIITAKVTAQETMYVATKQGLNVYEAPLFNSKILGKVAYGQKVIAIDWGEEEYYGKYNNSIMQTTIQEGLDGRWQVIKYKNKKAYIINTYLLPTAPPQKGITTIEGYFKQLSTIAGIAKTNKPFAGYTEKRVKTLYNNGMEAYIIEDGYHETYTLPDFSVQQAFLLVRLLKFKSIEAKDSLPTPPPGKEEITLNSTNGERSYEVIRYYGIKNISISKIDTYRIEIFESKGGQAIIYFYIDEPGC